jgi:hypothetical protein
MSSPDFYRSVHAKFWRDPKVKRWSDPARIAALYLLTGPHSTRTGVFEMPVGYMAIDLEWPLEKCIEALRELIHSGFLVHDAVHGTDWFVIRNRLRYDPPPNPNGLKAIYKALDAMPRHHPAWTALAPTLHDLAARHGVEIPWSDGRLTTPIVPQTPNQARPQARQPDPEPQPLPPQPQHVPNPAPTPTKPTPNRSRTVPKPKPNPSRTKPNQPRTTTEQARTRERERERETREERKKDSTVEYVTPAQPSPPRPSHPPPPQATNLIPPAGPDPAPARQTSQPRQPHPKPNGAPLPTGPEPDHAPAPQFDHGTAILNAQKRLRERQAARQQQQSSGDDEL